MAAAAGVFAPQLCGVLLPGSSQPEETLSYRVNVRFLPGTGLSLGQIRCCVAVRCWPRLCKNVELLNTGNGAYKTGS